MSPASERSTAPAEQPRRNEREMSDRIWILGAADPEMEAIEALLRECGETVVHATCGGQRVHPGNAYRADTPEGVGAATRILAVECGGDVLDTYVARRIDHHRPGDPGFGRPAAEFLSASSLGQVISELGALPDWDWYDLPDGWGEGGETTLIYFELPHPGWVVSTGSEHLGVCARIPQHLVLTAAADHCLGAAYRGECPGVDPDELMDWVWISTMVAYRYALTTEGGDDGKPF